MLVAFPLGLSYLKSTLAIIFYSVIGVVMVFISMMFQCKSCTLTPLNDREINSIPFKTDVLCIIYVCRKRDVRTGSSSWLCSG